MLLPISLIITHFVGDFLLQSNFMALNKSKSDKALVAHVLVYSMCFLPWGASFAFVTFLLHLITDGVTSRITSKLWFLPVIADSDTFTDIHTDTQLLLPGEYVVKPNLKKRHWFFTVIGVDQLIHYVSLAWTYKLLIG